MSRQRHGRSEAAAPRSDQTRDKLLSAALEIFGRDGYDGASTRRLAEAAGVNLQAIPYYFGSKHGLYLATADHLAAEIAREVAGHRAELQGRFAELDAAGAAMEPAEARERLTRLSRTMVQLFASSHSAAWARFMIREQQDPTEAFDRIYGGVLGPMLAVVCRLLGSVLGAPAGSERVRLQALMLFGSFVILRAARATVVRQMDWHDVGPSEINLATDLAAEIVARLTPSSGDRP